MVAIKTRGQSELYGDRDQLSVDSLQYPQPPVSCERGHSDSHETIGIGSCTPRTDLRTPWRVSDMEHRYKDQLAYYVLDRLGIVIGIFFDLKIAQDMTDSVNARFVGIPQGVR